MTHQIKVLNSNAIEFVDRFDGHPYKFIPKEPVNITPAAGRHIFGVDFPADAAACASDEFRAGIFYHLQRRWGWNSDKPENIRNAKKLFSNITFTPVMMQTVEIVAANDGDLAAPREEKVPAKGKAFKPRVTADEEEEVA